jgi:hypothetical protein
VDRRYLNYLEEKKLWIVTIFLVLNVVWMICIVLVLTVLEGLGYIINLSLLVLGGLLINYLVYQSIYEWRLLDWFLQDDEHHEEM